VRGELNALFYHNFTKQELPQTEKAPNSAKWLFPKQRKCQIRQNGSSPNGESAKYGKMALPQTEKTPNTAKWLFPKRRKCQNQQNGSSPNGENAKTTIFTPLNIGETKNGCKVQECQQTNDA